MTPSAEKDAPGPGPFYAWHPPILERAAEHGCLDEDVETGDPTPSDRWAGVTPAACDCDTRVLPPARGDA